MSAALACSFLFASTGWAAVGEVTVEKDVVFGKGGDVELKADVYKRADAEGKQPGVLLLYGGAWRSGNKDVMRILAEQVAREGFVAVASQYRLCPKNRFPAQVEDAKCAVRWMRASADKYGIDSNRIGAFGFSAGGHLALMLGMMNPEDGLEGDGGHAGRSSKVQVVVNYFGPVDFTLRDWNPKDEHLLVDFLGCKLDDDPALYRRVSPSTYIDSKDPPVLTIHGTKDPLVPYGQAVLVDKLLREKKAVSKLESVVGAGHGWWGPQLQHTQKLSMNFLKEHLQGKAAESDEKMPSSQASAK
jgi:acetyl esterase/lipase